MPVIHPALPANGDDAIVDVYNAALTAILTVLNGGVDTSNIASVAGASIVAGSIPMTAMDATVNAGWIPLSQSFTYGANNGQKEFTATTNADLTGVLSPGMRFKFTRGTVAPTQSMAFAAASTQFASKALPSGLSFTNAFTCEAWVYLNSYTGSEMDIISRLSTTGFVLGLSATGQPIIYAAAAGSSNLTTAYQSIPLKRWVHIAGTFSAGTTAIYINGTSVPTTSAGSGTALVQAGNLALGYNGSSNYFDGYSSEARIWSVAQTQGAIQANMGLSLTGVETNLAALFQGNGNFNDKTSNANNLTATNGAIATQLINPYHNVEYFFLTAISYANPTCTLTFFGGTDYMLPNMALLNPYYATVKSPYNFPASRSKWVVEYICRTDAIQVSPVSGTWYNLGSAKLTIPTGEWRARYNVPLGLAVSPAGRTDCYVTLSTANNSESDPTFTAASFGGGANTFQGNSLAADRSVTVAAITNYFLNSKAGQSGGTNLYNFGGSITAPTRIEAELAYA